MIVTVSPAFAPANLTELVRNSRLIVAGRCVRSLAPRVLGEENDGSVPVTDHLFLVTEVLQGKLPRGEEILVTQTGGKWKGSDFVATELAQFEPGVDAVLFLLPTKEQDVRTDDPPRYYVNGLWAGAFLVQDNLVSVLRSSSEALKKYSGLERAAFLVVVKDEVRKARETSK